MVSWSHVEDDPVGGRWAPRRLRSRRRSASPEGGWRRRPRPVGNADLKPGRGAPPAPGEPGIVSGVVEGSPRPVSMVLPRTRDGGRSPRASRRGPRPGDVRMEPEFEGHLAGCEFKVVEDVTSPGRAGFVPDAPGRGGEQGRGRMDSSSFALFRGGSSSPGPRGPRLLPRTAVHGRGY